MQYISYNKHKENKLREEIYSLSWSMQTLSSERKCPIALVGKFDCASLPIYDNPLVSIVCSERIPKPSEHQCSCSQKNNFFMGKERDNILGEKNQTLLCIF